MVAFQSFARAGNTMMRKFLETTTGLFTSSDMDLELTIHIQMLGLLGEENVTDTNLTWITKTHWPTPTYKVKFHAQKMIVIVRNPIDIIPSMCGLLQTISHSLTP